jgi:hypothetical protein
MSMTGMTSSLGNTANSLAQASCHRASGIRALLLTHRGAIRALAAATDRIAHHVRAPADSGSTSESVPVSASNVGNVSCDDRVLRYRSRPRASENLCTTHFRCNATLFGADPACMSERSRHIPPNPCQSRAGGLSVRSENRRSARCGVRDRLTSATAQEKRPSLE